MNKIFLLFLFLASSLMANIPLTLEHVWTEDKIQWGLMQRRELPENQGMLFHLPQKRITHVWMFNCFIDLSVAFLDERGIIREIHELKSYPEKMDPSRPVVSLSDIKKYPINDPITLFFIQNSVRSSFKVSYVLEMNAHWFQKMGVKRGDRLVWSMSSPQAYVVSKDDKDGRIFRRNSCTGTQWISSCIKRL